MSNFKDHVEMFLTELMQDSYKDLKEKDENFRDTKASHVKASDKFYKAIESLITSDKQFVEDYLEEKAMLDSIETDWFYLQGYKDCIKLLRFIEAI